MLNKVYIVMTEEYSTENQCFEVLDEDMAFSTRDKAEEYIQSKVSPEYYNIKELELY